MTKTEKERLANQKLYLTNILKPCWIQGLIDKHTYDGLIKRMSIATPEQVNKAIQMFKSRLDFHHDSKGQSRKNTL